jgi:hypothetical protein
MARKKYIYHHLVNNKEVSKDDFIKALQPHCMRCDTNYENPLWNVYYLDTYLLKRKYNYHKTHPHYTTVYIGDKNKSTSFRIKREEVV